HLRAMLRATIGLTTLKLLFPMLSGLADVAAAIRLLDRACEEVSVLTGERVERPPVGVMLEVPSLLFLLPELKPYIDFLSVGTTDLPRYLLAVARNNTHV
ncbi:putative PEP-binding protein, partial [Morganella morganii]|uniref:putative PEP-binding protein n=1 Tax=Morganella morganii TaxID=582 RepID=UPI0019FB5ACC|nr:phosphoenolpyruvate-protein phosphotransferase PtsP [Morganella morganii]